MTIRRYVPHCSLALEAMALAFPPVTEPHPNRVPWQGILCQVDEPSTRAPQGAQQHRVLIPRAVADQALPSLLGMPINYSATFDGHDKQQPIGSISEAHFEGNNLCVSGFLYGKNFPETVAYIQGHTDVLGMSYELSACEIRDPGAAIWTLTHFVFTGAAILRKDAAAYHQTAIAAAAEEESRMEQTVLQNLEALSAKLDVLANQEAEDDAAQAATEEAEALAAEAEAARALTAAQRAQADHDTEDAQASYAVAATKYQEAATKRARAIQRHTLLAARCTEAGETEAAATHHEALTRLTAQETAATESRTLAAKGCEVEAAEDDDASLFTRFVAFQQFKQRMDAMTYPATSAQEHDDEEEDKKLFRELMKKEDQSATARPDLAIRRQLRSLQASMELLTDTVSKLTGLVTDTVAARGRLLTESPATGANGGQVPVRRSLQATTEAWVSKDGPTTTTPKKTLADLDAQWRAEGLTNRQRMTRELEARQQGLL